MASNVFANGMEVSAEKSDNQSIAAMPDVCLSPPTPPAGPIPIPYPNFSKASDTAEGTQTVQIAGGTVGMKNQSYYKQSNGDEAATKSQGMGVVTACIQGKTYFAAWSSDVKFEGANAIRFGDMTTHNHASTPMNSGGTGINMGSLAPPKGDPECKKLEKESRKAITNDTTNGVLPKGVAHVTAVDSTGATFKAAQPPDCIKSSASSGYAKPHGKKNHPCKGKPYNPNSQGNKDHSECKVMHQAIVPTGVQAGGSITMRINWNTGGKPPRLSNNPCQQCMGSICETAKECDVKIYICKGKPMEKKEAPCKQTQHRDPTQGYNKRGYTNSWKGDGW